MGCGKKVGTCENIGALNIISVFKFYLVWIWRNSLLRKHAVGAGHSKGLCILHFVQFQVHSAAYFSVDFE